MPTLVGMVIVPITSCSNQTSTQTGTIEIVSNIADVTVTEDEDHLSSPIEVKCLSHDQKELDYEFKLKLTNNEPKPDWISINDKNQIQLKGDKKVGTYTFSLSAFNETQHLYSNEKTFSVNVINQRHIAPTSLSMSTTDDWYYMYGENSTQEIDITPSKEGVEEKYLINDVECKVEIIKGKKTTDLLGNNLFSCFDDGCNHKLVISANTNSTYCGSYLLKITATLLVDPNVTISKDIRLNLANVYQYSDTKSKCTFSRTKDEQGWTLSTFDASQGNVLYDVPSEIYHRPVTKVADNFCEKSQIKQLVEALLPSSITTIGDNAFSNQTALSCIDMSGVRYIGDGAFKNAGLLEYRSGYTKPSLVLVGDDVFNGCDKFKLTDFTELIWAGENAFANTSIETAIVGENCKYLGGNSFANCLNLKKFKIYSEEPPILGGNIFYRSDNLTTINVPVDSLVSYSTDSSWKNLNKRIEGI